MRFLWRVVLVLVVFVGVGRITSQIVGRHATQAGAYEPEVRLGAAMAGLFAGGFAATVVGIVVIWPRKKN